VNLTIISWYALTIIYSSESNQELDPKLRKKKACSIEPASRKKSTSPQNISGLEHITSKSMKMNFLPPQLSKTEQITLEVVLKNHNKSQKNHKMENPIVLILNEYIYIMNI
jgi:hypothetical protein